MSGEDRVAPAAGLSIGAQVRRCLDIEALVPKQPFGRLAGMFLLFVLSLPPLIFIGLAPDWTSGQQSTDLPGFDRTAFTICALLYLAGVLVYSTPLYRNLESLRWHLPVRRGLPVLAHLALWGAVWLAMVGGLSVIFPSQAVGMGVPVLLLGWLALPLTTLSVPAPTVVQISLYGYLVIGLLGVGVVGVGEMAATGKSAALLNLLLSFGVLLSWCLALGLGRVAERVPVGSAEASRPSPSVAIGSGRAPLASLFRATHGPLWAWTLGALGAGGLLLLLQRWNESGASALLFLMPVVQVCMYGAGALLKSANRGHRLILQCTPADRRGAFLTLHVPAFALLLLPAGLWLDGASGGSIRLRPTSQEDGRGGTSTVVDYQCRGGLIRGSWSGRTLRAGSVGEFGAGLRKSLTADWGTSPDATEIEGVIRAEWNGAPPESSALPAFEEGCERIASALSERMRPASRAQALLVVLAAGAVFGLYFHATRRPRGWSLPNLIAPVSALTGFLVLVVVLNLKSTSPWVQGARGWMTEAAISGWWLFVSAWIVGLGWLGTRCRDNFVAMDLEDVERLDNSKGGLVPVS